MFRIFRRFCSTEEFRTFLKSTGDGFDGVAKKLKIIKAGDGTCIAEMMIEKEHTNPLDGLHGGLSATLVDIVSSYALLTDQSCELVPSVSVDMHITYLNQAKLGEEIIINAHTIKAGKTLAFLECQIKNKATNKTVVNGTHTKYLMRY